MTTQLRQPPHDEKVELNFLTCITEDTARYDAAMKMYPLTADDFFNERNRIAFGYIQTAIADGAKQVNGDRLLAMSRAAGTEHKVDTKYCLDVVTNTALVSDATYYAGLIKHYSKKRQGISIAEKFLDAAYEPGDEKAFQLAFANLESEAYRSINESNDERHIGPRLSCDIYTAWLQDAREKMARGESAAGVATGFTGLDNLITGLKPGTMNIFAAQPGVGKTALGLNIIENMLKNPAVRYPAVVFSIEMSAEQIVWRVVSAFTNVPVQHFQNFKLTDGDVGRLANFFNRPQEVEVLAKLYIDDDSTMTPNTISQRCRRIVDRCGGISAIMVDHVQIMSGDQKSYQSDVSKYGEISRQLKGISKDFKCPVIVLSQLSRKIDDRKDHEPKNSDLKETSCLEQDADLICFIQRDMSNPENGQARLKITKNRHGAMGDVELAYYNNLTLFANPDDYLRD